MTNTEIFKQLFTKYSNLIYKNNLVICEYFNSFIIKNNTTTYIINIPAELLVTYQTAYIKTTEF